MSGVDFTSEVAVTLLTVAPKAEDLTVPDLRSISPNNWLTPVLTVAPPCRDRSRLPVTPVRKSTVPIPLTVSAVAPAVVTAEAKVSLDPKPTLMVRSWNSATGTPRRCDPPLTCIAAGSALPRARSIDSAPAAVRVVPPLLVRLSACSIGETPFIVTELPPAPAKVAVSSRLRVRPSMPGWPPRRAHFDQSS